MPRTNELALQFQLNSMAANKKTRSDDAVTHNALKLHPTKALPFVLECRVLEFLPDCLVALSDTSRSMKALVEGHLCTCSSFSVNPIIEQSEDEVRVLKLVGAHCRRLQTLTLPAWSSLPKLWVSAWLCQLIAANASSFQEMLIYEV